MEKINKREIVPPTSAPKEDHKVCISLHLSVSFSQVVTWLQGPGSELLKTHQAIGDSMRAAQALQQKHEEIESQHSVMQHNEHMIRKEQIQIAQA